MQVYRQINLEKVRITYIFLEPPNRWFALKTENVFLCCTMGPALDSGPSGNHGNMWSAVQMYSRKSLGIPKSPHFQTS